MSKGLGKGLSALISERPAAAAATNVSRETTAPDDASLEAFGGARQLPLAKLQPGVYQPRGFFDKEELDSLSASIKKNGVVQPVIVRRRADGDLYEIIAGERRWRASKLAGLTDIPAIVMDLDDNQALEIALVENIQRRDLRVLEEAEGYQRLMDEFSYTQEQLADAIGKSRPHIANTLRLLGLPDDVKRLLNEDKISAGHARALLRADEIMETAQQVISQKLSVRDTEALIKREKEQVSAAKQPAAPQRDTEIDRLERLLAERYDAQASIKGDAEKGEIRLCYSSREELNLLFSKLGLS